MILTGTTKIGIQQIKLSIYTSEENYENFESNFKIGLCGHLTIQLICATDAESRGNQTVNHNMWLHGGYHDYEFKSQWISRYPFIYENEWKIWLNYFHSSHNTILLKLSDGYRKPTDVEMSLTKACWKEKPDRKL
jgi:hypothetical protein